MTSKQTLDKIKSPFIYTFNHEGPAVINVMRDLMVVLFEHLDITSRLDLDLRIKYIKRILRGSYINKFLIDNVIV